MRGVAGLVAVAVVVAGCSSGGRECTDVGAPAGVGIEVVPAVAGSISTGQMEICWDGHCLTRELTLAPSTTTGASGCAGSDPSSACSAQVEPTGGKHAFAAVPGLPTSDITVTVGFDGGPTRTVHLTPKMLFPNGPDCGGLGPQGQLVLTADGSVQIK